VTFEETVRAAIDRVVSEARERLEAELRAEGDRLVEAAAAERTLAASQAADAAASEVWRDATAQLDQFRETARAETDELKRAADVEIAGWKTRLDELQRTHKDEIDGVLQTAHVEIDDARRMAATQVDDVQREFEQRLAHANAETDRANAEVARVSAQIDSANAQAETVRRETAEQARTDARRLAEADAARLVEAVSAIDAADSLADVLDALARAAGAEVERAAVFIVRGERLQGWRWSGFSSAVSPRSIDLPLNRAGIAGDALRHQAAVRWSLAEPRDDARLPELATPPDASGGDETPVRDSLEVREALALPVSVGGVAVAVLYADTTTDDGPTGSGRWTGTLDVLARYAGRALEAVTLRRATSPTPFRGVARASHSAPPRASEGDRSGGEDGAIAVHS
jgi:hypothetical protein